MDMDKAFVYAILTGGREKLNEVMAKGFTKTRLRGEGAKLYDEILTYFGQYDDLPSVSMIEAKFGVTLDPVQEPADFFAHELEGREICTLLGSVWKDTEDHMKQGDPWEALLQIASGVRKVQEVITSGEALQSLPALTKLAYDWYLRIKAGERGILTPWPTVNNTTLGLWPEDFILFVARGGVGKSWAAVLIAHCAWMAGKKVLFLTTEMSKLAISRRFSAVHLRLPYGQVTSGTLGSFEEERWQKATEELECDTRWKIIGGNFNYHVGSLWAYVDSFEPDLLVVDGLYLLRTEERYDKKNEQAASVYDEVKRGAKRFKLPIVATTQFNRTVKPGAKDPDIAGIAQTDASGWNADCAYALMQDADMKLQKRMMMQPMKVREGRMEPFESNWDFDCMDFTELVKVTHSPPGSGTPPTDPGAAPGDPNDIMTLF